MVKRIISRLGKQSKPFLTALGFSLVLLLGFIDYATGPDLSFFIFYIGPVFLTAWFVGKWAGGLISIVSTIVWFTADVMSISSYSHPVIPYWNGTMKIAFLLLINHVVSELRCSLEREKALARTDSLTALANRRAFYEAAKTEILMSARYGRIFTVAFIDIDDFKTVNDQFGHDAGDDLLCATARVLREHTRTTDLSARLGGDEFAILLPGAGADSARTILHKLQKRLLNEMQKNGWPTTFSIGVVTFCNAPGSVKEALMKADSLMYSVKSIGKNRIAYETLDKPDMMRF